MFLATTADQRFWKPGENYLFLGEWCKLYRDRKAWDHPQNQTLPYHWEDREKLARDYVLIHEIYERTLAELGQRLNEIHHGSYSNRYWRLLLSPWLLYFTEILFDRYTMIERAKESGLVTNTWIPQYVSRSTETTTDYTRRFVQDPFNLILYSDIIRELGLPQETIETSITFDNEKRVSGLKNKIKALPNLHSRLLPSVANSVVFQTEYLSRRQLLDLQLKLRQMPSIILSRQLPRAPFHVPDASKRANLNSTRTLDGFEKFLWKMIPMYMPLVYIENYEWTHRKALRRYPKKPKVIVTSSSHMFDEAFKFWSAHQSDTGAKFVCSQHGGHYGTGKWSSLDDHELKISDKYFTWGWGEEHRNVSALPSPQLSRAAKKLKFDPKGQILWVGMTAPRYSYRLYTLPTGPSFLDFIEQQKRFAGSLSMEAFRQTIYRAHPQDYNWSLKERLLEVVPGLRIHNGPETLHMQMNQSRLFVGTYNATTYLEPFAANFPTVIFWNPKYQELNPHVHELFDALKSANVFFETPEAAAKHVNAIYEDPLKWWSTPKVQSARIKFCERFARASDTWADEWARELKSLSHL